MTLSPIIASVDPGLDLTAIAFFDLRRWDPATSYTVAVRALTARREEIVTSPKDLLVARLLHLEAEAHRIATDAEAPGVVYVELPAIEGGGYRGMRTDRGVTRNAAAVGKLHMAIGAVVAGFARAGAAVVPFPAPQIGKENKHRAVRALLHATPLEALYLGPLGGESADMMDAIFNGLHVLTDPGLRPPKWVSAP